VNLEISSEIQKLFDVVRDQLGSEHPEGFTTGLPMFSNTLTEEQTEEIRAGLQARLAVVADGAVPVVTVDRPQDENQAGQLKVNFLKGYAAELGENGWFVDIQGDACWYFKAADEYSAKKLANYFNLGKNRVKLDMHRPEVALEVSLVKTWLLHLRDADIAVTKVGYKSTGKFEEIDLAQ
jgi:hypothetical protein